MIKEELIKKLKAEFENNEHTDYVDWYEYASSIGSLIDEAGFRTSIEDASNNDGDSYIMITYYSEKLGKAIILDWDAYQNVESLDELIGLFVDWELQGMELDRRIIRQKK